MQHDRDRHARSLLRVANAPIRPGNRITLFEDAMPALRAMFEAIRSAQSTVVLEYYTFENVEADGTQLVALLRERLEAGVAVCIIYDAIGSDHTPSRTFDMLRQAGAAILDFHALDPFKRTFSLDVDGRDHRKILVVDDRVAFLGGVNLDRQYMNPRAAGIPADGNTARAFWQDAAARFEGPVVADIRAIHDHTWRRLGGTPVARAGHAPEPIAGGEDVCVEGSAPRQGRPLHTRAILAAIRDATSRIWIATGYFVPMPDEILALRRAALRGVSVNLVLPGVSDVPGAIHAGRGSYGRLLRAGVHIHEMKDAVLHAKVATIDGVWTSIGSSNFDRRSARLNNEVDAVILGEPLASSVETMMQAWSTRSRKVTLASWQSRPFTERLAEFTTLFWKRLM